MSGKRKREGAPGMMSVTICAMGHQCSIVIMIHLRTLKMSVTICISSV
jgi:hypothetical protein